jgi:hypothetical protein
MNLQYVRKLEDLILQLSSTLADIEVAKQKGYLSRDLPVLHQMADTIRANREKRRPRRK